ncbi:MAG: alpha/beta hydrolase [Microthrixaceae bacterium]
MRQGCDPEVLESMADGWAALGDSLSRIRARVERAHRGTWSGPDARRCRVELDRIASELGSLSVTVDMAARRLLAQAAQQRRASEADVTMRTLERSEAGDGRWVGWLGPADATIVVVLVPGVGTDLADRDSLELDARRVREHLQLVAARLRTGETVAVVAWLGYDPPDDLLAGLRRRPAAEGAAHLVVDVERWHGVGTRQGGGGRSQLRGAGGRSGCV